MNSLSYNILMFVYNDLNNDARVQKSALALSEYGSLTVISTGKDTFFTDKYDNVVFEPTARKSIFKYLQFVFFVLNYYREVKYHVVYSHDYFTALPMLIIKLLSRRTKYIYDAHELFIPYKNERITRRERFFYYFEKRAIKSADLVVCAQQQRSEIMKEHFNLSRLPLVIRNITELTKTNIYKNPELDRFMSIEGITVVYAGVISQDRNIGALIDLLENANNYKLLVIGDGNDRANINHKVKNINSNRIMCINSVPHSQLYSVLVRCDIGFLSYPLNKLNNQFCAPNKIFEYASAGLAMVSKYNPTIKYELDTYNIGVCDDDILSAIETVSNNLEFYKSKLDNFLRENTWGKEVQKLKDEIEGILNTVITN